MSKRADTWSRCGHPRTLENTAGNQCISYCRTCRDKRLEAQREARLNRDKDIVAAYQAGESIVVLARAHSIGCDRVRRILSENGVNARDEPVDPLYPLRAMRIASQIVGYDIDVVTGPWRWPDLARARFALMYAMRKRGASLSQIGHRLGGRDHSTIMHGIRRAKVLAQRDSAFAEMLERVDAA